MNKDATVPKARTETKVRTVEMVTKANVEKTA